jgi:hypothetical protein
MRLTTMTLAAPVCAALLWSLGAAADDLTATRTIEDSVPVGGERGLVLIVSDVFGSIRVTAHDRDTVDVKAVETVRGKLQADLDKARAEVGLRTQHEPGRVAFRVRRLDDKDDGDCPCRGNRWDDYSVAYDIEVKVPRSAAVDLSTVNGGDITVDGVQGDFVVHNVNGAVRLTGLRGSGEITTVNGPIEATFERAPAAATRFKTVNGKLDVTFPQALAADLELETTHGDMLTDFDTQAVARTATNEPPRNGGKRVYSSRGPSLVRVGAGGPTYSFQTVNGAIYIRKAVR